MAIDIDAIEARAKAATQGKWFHRTSPRMKQGFVQVDVPGSRMAYGLELLCDDYTGYGDDEQRELDCAYVASVSPNVVLELIHRLRAAEAIDCAARRRVFVDMDGVLVDFDAYKTAMHMTGDEVKKHPGAYLEMPPIAGALEAVRSIIAMGYEVWIATKPPTGVQGAYADKAAWIFKYLPELKRRIIITHDKGLLGGVGDFLCDDRPHKANCQDFPGTLLAFVDGYHWPQALEHLRQHRPQRAG